MIGKNNPLNIRNSDSFTWCGQNGSTRGFCDFINMRYGRRAGAYLLMRSYPRFGVVSIAAIINRFAPPSENDTKAYIAFVCRWSQIPDFRKIDSRMQFARILAAMTMFEQGIPLMERAEFFERETTAYFDIVQEFKIVGK